jgi:hypothetical protein
MDTRSLARIAPLLLSLATSIPAAGCLGTDEPVTDVRIPLSYRTPLGDSYRLRNATLLFDGRTDEVVTPTEAELEDAVEMALPEGQYSVTLGDGWTLERSSGGGPFVAVPAELVTDPRPFALQPDRDYVVGFQFRIDEGEGRWREVTFRRGPTMRIAGTLDVHEATGSLAGEAYQARPISYELSFEPDIQSLISAETGLWERAYAADDVRVRFVDDPVGVLRAADVSNSLVEYRLQPTDGVVETTGSFTSKGLTVSLGRGWMDIPLDSEGHTGNQGFAGEQPFELHDLDETGAARGTLFGPAAIEVSLR